MRCWRCRPGFGREERETPDGGRAGRRGDDGRLALPSGADAATDHSCFWLGPISVSMLPTIASVIDEGLRDGREHYATLLEARPKPYVLDDATIERTKRVNREGLEWCGVYDRQLLRWRSQRLTDAQRYEIARLEAVQRDLRLVLTRILELVEELGQGTIERQLAKSDVEVGLEHLLRSVPRV